MESKKDKSQEKAISEKRNILKEIEEINIDGATSTTILLTL